MQIFVQLRNPVSRNDLLAGDHGQAVGGEGVGGVGDREDLVLHLKIVKKRGNYIFVSSVNLLAFIFQFFILKLFRLFFCVYIEENQGGSQLHIWSGWRGTRRTPS